MENISNTPESENAEASSAASSDGLSAPTQPTTSLSPAQAAETPPATVAPTDLVDPVSDATVSSAVINSSSAAGSTNRRHIPKAAALIAAGVVLLAATAYGGYVAGKHSVHPMVASTATQTGLSVPAGATIIEKCEPGLGTQYILPKDIPDGPVYDVYQGKVIGIEYMATLSEINKQDVAINDLKLFGQKYDHVNIMSMAAHGGMPMPHYQMDVMMVPDSVAKKITCGGTSSSSNMSGSSATQPSSSSTMSGSSSMQPSSSSSSSTVSSGMKM